MNIEKKAIESAQRSLQELGKLIKLKIGTPARLQSLKEEKESLDKKCVLPGNMLLIYI